MFDVKDTLLPPTATPLAKALDILEERLFGLPVQAISKDPASVDVGLLDHLAWEHSVDVWPPQWSESAKRRAITISTAIHRHKGTPHAIREALVGAGFACDLVEWFQVSPELQRGTFHVDAYLGVPWPDGAAIPSDTPVIVERIIQRNAPVSRGFSYRVGSLFGSDLSCTTGASVAVRLAGRTHVQRAPIRAALTAGYATAACAAVRLRGRAIARPVPVSAAPRQYAASGGIAAVRLTGAAIAKRYSART